MPSASIAPRTHVAPYAWAAVRLIALFKARAHLNQQLTVLLAATALRALHPIVESAARDTERLAHLLCPPCPSVLCDELEPHRGSFAK
jgi:hypothetical protein